jgi:tripartite-type tricarboxylate transporter receptor subunit TctC
MMQHERNLDPVAFGQIEATRPRIFIVTRADAPEEPKALSRDTLMVRLIVAIVLAMLSANGALAQAWPNKPVKIVVGFPAGGGTDTVARVLADRLGDALGQRFIVENRGGANGNIGADAVAKSAPDGYTLLVSSSDLAVNPIAMKTMNYDPQKDLAPITLIAWTPLMIVVHPDLSVSTPAQLIALLRNKPGQLNYSSPGSGSAHHLAGEYLKKIANVEMQHVSYRGAGPAVQDAVAGHVPITISGMPPVVELVKADRLRAIAVTSAKRSSLFPNTMALVEFGPEYKDFDFTNWFGLLAPAGVPDAVLKRLHATAVKALSEPSVVARIAEQGAEVVGDTPEQFAAFLRVEIEKYAHVAKLTGIGTNP